MQIKIGKRVYTVESTKTARNHHGQNQRYTDMKGKKGAQVTLVETFCKHGTVATLIHFGRMNPRENINAELIDRS